MTFWVYNDSGNSHAESGAVLPLKMEVQVQTFAYSTSDEINNMTFQRYKLINRAITSIDSTYFAWWVDPDLGCYTDDYVGCDVERSMAYVYNEDAIDGTTGCNCDQGLILTVNRCRFLEWITSAGLWMKMEWNSACLLLLITITEV